MAVTLGIFVLLAKCPITQNTGSECVNFQMKNGTNCPGKPFYPSEVTKTLTIFSANMGTD